MYDYQIIDAWLTTVTDVEREFRIIQYEGSDEFVIERIGADETTLAEPSPMQMSREQAEEFFAAKSEIEIAD